MQIVCGLKCLDTDGCLTLRYKDGVCDLGGFHVIRDGSDSEMCYFNDGESFINIKSRFYSYNPFHVFVLDKLYFLFSVRIHRHARRRKDSKPACLGSRVRDQF